MKLKYLYLGSLLVIFASCSTLRRDSDKAKVVVKGANEVPTVELGGVVTTKLPLKENQQDALDSQSNVEATPLKSLNWDYKNYGPSQWANLQEDYLLCSKGLEQSPVNLKWTKPMVARSISFFYQPGVFQVEIQNQKLQVTFAKGNHTQIDGERWNLVAMQFHTPSEHKFSNKTFPLEIHFVHYNQEQTKLGIIAVVFKEGQPHVGFDALIKQFPKKNPDKVFVDSELVNPSVFLPLTTTHYLYQGSLTYPPCTEGVVWNVLNTPVEASKEQIEAIQKIVGQNSRPVQLWNHRKPMNYR